MAKPNFETMNGPELESWIQARGQDVDALRADMREAHDFLEMRNQQDRRRLLEARPPDFPPTQEVGK